MIRILPGTWAAVALGLLVAGEPSGADARACAGPHSSAVCAKPKAAEPKQGAKTPKRETKAKKKPADPNAPALDATTLACNQEYEDNKAAIDGGGQSRAKFIKDCKNGTETVPGGIKTGAAAPASSGPPPDKQLPNADPKSGRPIVDKDDQVTGSTRRR